VKTCREIPNLVEIKQKISVTLHGNRSAFYCCQRRLIAMKVLSLSEMVSDCRDEGGGINITRKQSNFTIHVHCQSLPKLKFLAILNKERIV
jgi:hypothetical protein